MLLRYFFTGLFISFASHGFAQVSDFESVDFSKADKRAKQNFGKSLDNLPLLANNLTSGLETDVERFRVIYIWVCQNIKNDYKLYAKNKRKRKRFEEDSVKLEQWNDRFKKKVFATLSKRRRTICTGYAYIVKVLSELADIDCKIIDGFGKTSTTSVAELTTANHSWNAVKLNNKWYLCDPTWASGTQSLKNGRFEFNYNDGLFLVPPQLFALSHFPADRNWLLLDDAYTLKQFIEAPIIYGETYNFLIAHNAPQKFENEVLKNHVLKINVSLKPNTIPKNVALLIEDGISIKTVTPKVEITEEGQLNISHTLKKTGFFDIHLFINQQLIATYVYRVKRSLK